MQYTDASNGVTFAYRQLGLDDGLPLPLPLLMHIHFRVNMNFRDPDLVNDIAAQRPVIVFDQAGSHW